MAKKIAFQGELGAFSHQACLHQYPDYQPLPCPTFEDALMAIREGEAELGMMPIENTLHGRVSDLYQLLPDSNLFIIAEYYLPIRLQLLAVKGASLSDIKTAHTHAAALGQCRNFLRRHQIKPVTAADTAGSARYIAELKDKTTAAIASEVAGKIYDLITLASDIEDAAHNTTRFLVMSREQKKLENAAHPVTTFVFTVRNVPAALYKALGGFATNGVNLTKLESYMVNGSFNATRFYIDIEGHPDDTPIKHAMEELTFFTNQIKILGIYSRHKSRYASQ